MYLDPNSFQAALAVERGSVWVAPGVVGIPLKRKGRRTGQLALLSFEDRHIARDYYWSPSRWGYPRRRDKDGNSLFLHRLVMGCESGDGTVVDHINRDKVDCRRENLRFVTQAENAQNQGGRRETSSRHRGVSYRKRTGKWIVMHGLNGKSIYGGSFDTEAEAAAAARSWRDEHMPFAGDSSQHRGVSWDKERGKWKAQAKVNYRNKLIGRFGTEEEANAAVTAWRREHMPHSSD